MKGFDFQGACDGVDTELFFDEEYTDEVKKLCETCPFRQQCLEDSLRLQDLFGVFGNTTGKERRRALCVDINGRATGHAPICPVCGSKQVEEEYKTRTRNTCTCTTCEFIWECVVRLKIKLTSTKN